MLAFAVTAAAEASEVDYSKVLYSGTGAVAGIPIVRYLAWSDDCVVIQNLVPGGNGTVSAEKNICSVNGEKISNGYADVDFKKGTFVDEKLFIELGITPLQPVGEKVMTCEVIFDSGLADHLSCKEKIEKE